MKIINTTKKITSLFFILIFSTLYFVQISGITIECYAIDSSDVKIQFECTTTYTCPREKVDVFVSSNQDVDVTLQVSDTTIATFYSFNNGQGIIQNNELIFHAQSNQSYKITMLIRKAGTFKLIATSNNIKLGNSDDIESALFYYVDADKNNINTLNKMYIGAYQAYMTLPANIRNWFENDSMFFKLYSDPYVENKDGGRAIGTCGWGISLYAGSLPDIHRVTLHELGHAVGHHIKKITPEMEQIVEDLYDPEDSYFRSYGRSSAGEFFADAVAFYYMDAKSLQKNSPRVYEILNNFLTNIESYAVPDINRVQIQINSAPSDFIKDITSTVQCNLRSAISFRDLAINGCQYCEAYDATGKAIYKGNSAFICIQEGKYKVKIQTRFGDKIIKERIIYLNVPNHIINQSIVLKENITLGQSVTLKFLAANVVGTKETKCYIREPNQTTYKLLQNFTTDSKLEYLPKKSGTYYLKTKMRDDRGKLSEKILTFNVSGTFECFTSISRSEIPINNSLTISLRTKCNVGNTQTKIYVMTPGSKTYKVYCDFTPTYSFHYTPTKVGTYQFRLKTKDTTGKLIVNDIVCTCK